MPYSRCLIYNLDGDFIGWAILKPNGDQLKSVNIWPQEHLDGFNTQIDRLNADLSIRASWPQPTDPDVVALLSDPEWEPIKMEEVQEVDEDNSHYVYNKETMQIDKEASVLAYFPPRMVAVSPVEAVARTKRAQETIARRRLTLPE
jgi:hypothetical protein